MNASKPSAIAQVTPIGGVTTQYECIAVALITLPDRYRPGEEVVLVRLSLRSERAGCVSVRLGPKGLGELLTALQAAQRAAFGGHS